MRINPITGILRIALNIILCVSLIFACLAFVLIILIKNRVAYTFALYLLVVFVAKNIIELCFWLINNYSKKSVLFTKEYVVYKGEKYFIRDISFRYLTFQWALLESVAVVPKLIISFRNSQNLTCYISKKELKKLKRDLEYEIVEI